MMATIDSTEVSAESSRPQCLRLNGEELPWDQACARLRRFTSRQALALGGGLLLRAGWAGETLAAAAEPNFVNGNRNYHYDMKLHADDGPRLAGDLRPSGEVALLPQLPAPPAPPALPADTESLRRLCRTLARALIDSGLPGGLPLAPLSRQALLESARPGSKLPPDVLRTLADLVAWT